MSKRQIINYVKKTIGTAIDVKDTKVKRFPWKKYQFTYFRLSRGVIYTVRTLFDREFVTPYFKNHRNVKDFFEKYSNGKSLGQLKWFDFFVFTIDNILKKNRKSLDEVVNKLKDLSGYLQGKKGNPRCPQLTKAQIILALIRRYGTAFNSFLTEKQMVKKLAIMLRPYKLNVRGATAKEDAKGADLVVYNAKGYKRRYNVKTSKHDENEVKVENGVTVISMSRYVDVGDLKKEHYRKILQQILKDAGLVSKIGRKQQDFEVSD